MKILAQLLILIGFIVNAQDTPFNCNNNAYLFQYNDVYAVDLASGNSYLAHADVTPGNINATAYNPADGYIWGSLSSPSKTIVRIGQNFETTTLYIDELPTNNRYVGDVSAEGIYYLKGGGSTYYKVNLNPESANYGEFISSETLSQNISIHDWAFNAVDGNLYALEKNTNILYRINPVTSEVQALGVVPVLSGLNYTYGAVYFDASGRFYASANQTGTIYVIQAVQDLNGQNTIESNLFAFGPASSQNDGARCPSAAVPQEDCDNGIDDDGDGLIDCEDPSCSGYSSCPVIEITSTSSANLGGLESNNRLSQQVSKRNFGRAKTGYIFDQSAAKKLTKTPNYGKHYAQRGGLTQLSDFIPLEVINEELVVESSPTDLIGITNATEVYSVDYIKNEEAVASILVLKTDRGVYEHTKYICDRLLGAQLISVSNIEIKGQNFIKALIRNIDGSLEFVLSLSAKAINNDSEFGIESHWNLDKYTSKNGYYNFQIWSNSLDDLLLLGEEVLHLLEVQKPITNYNNSSPPTVFVRKGKYHNGKLDLQIVNTNRTASVAFDGGVRSTETDIVETVSSSIALNGNYISNLEVDAGNLFDIGFRIGDGLNTPDDLFMSDGPWGYDDAAITTNVTSYTVESNSSSFDENVYSIERNINLEATTSEYIAAYRALTPKFNAINLTAFNSFNFTAKGTGILILRLVKESVTNWEQQYRTSIELTPEFKNFSIPFLDFKTLDGSSIEVSDVTSIVFTMLAENGEVETKTMTLEQLYFSNNILLSVTPSLTENTIDVVAIPNPMTTQTTIQFTAANTETVKLLVYNQVGRLVKELEVNSQKGLNEVILKREKLSSGIYFCNIISNQTNYKTTKLLLD
ncbi:DUF6923 family protein [Algibacter luteus]|nr:T9SS type A sorting domain-containing protein [Algibacter luteus]